MFYFYIVRCSDNSLYCGQTNDLQRRIKEHNFDKNKSAKYLRAKKPVKLVYFEEYFTLKEVLKREWQVKQWTKAKKEALINMTFRERVYQITKQIPKGKVATYGQIARLAGRPKAYRVIGLFMRTNPSAPVVPCHRVVGSRGQLTGYSGGKGISTKKDMLISEGVVFVNDIVDLSRSQWNF